MKQATFLSVAAFICCFAVSIAAAGQDKAKVLTAIGPVVATSADSVTVDAGKGNQVFMTTSSTKVKVTGGSTKTEAAKEAGAKGVKVTDLVHQGDQVSVKYTDVGGKLTASEIEVKQRRPPSTQPVKPAK